MPKSFEALAIIFFVLPGIIAARVHAQQLPLKESSTFDKLGITVAVSTLIHAIMLPLWYRVASQGGIVPGFVDPNDGFTFSELSDVRRPLRTPDRNRGPPRNYPAVCRTDACASGTRNPAPGALWSQWN